MHSTRVFVIGVVALATLGFPVALGACGASAPSGDATTTNSSVDAATHYATELKFSECMRSHDVPGFPDPTPNATSSGGAIRTVLGIVLPAALNVHAPAFRSALTTCRKLVVGFTPEPVSAATKLQLIQSAECMRKHGVPNFPDPTFPAGGGIAQSVGPAADAQSPAFKHALAVCGGA
jgi:hypothetical protein